MSLEAPINPPWEKIVNVDRLVGLVQLDQKEGKSVGLITGGFDIVHLGHLRLFRYAKTWVDVLAVGVEQDETVRLSKGENRPVNKLADRCSFLAELTNIDYVFAIPFVFQYGQVENADRQYAQLYELLRPNCLITNMVADKFWEQKKRRAEEMNIRFLLQGSSWHTSSTSTLEKIIEELL